MAISLAIFFQVRIKEIGYTMMIAFSENTRFPPHRMNLNLFPRISNQGWSRSIVFLLADLQVLPTKQNIQNTGLQQCCSRMAKAKQGNLQFPTTQRQKQ